MVESSQFGLCSKLAYVDFLVLRMMVDKRGVEREWYSRLSSDKYVMSGDRCWYCGDVRKVGRGVKQSKLERYGFQVWKGG